MSFGDGIKALLDTYENCISLLKAFGGGRDENGTVKTQPERSHLRRSLRSDRSLVERTYSSKLSDAGSRLSKGDARAITALDRILKRLRNAITSLLRLSSKRDGLDLDYQSLMSLSNASRSDAIKAIDSLSRRLGSPSRSSVVSSSSTKASSKASSSQRKHKSSSNARRSASKPSSKVQRTHSPNSKRPADSKEGKRTTSKERNADTERIRKTPPQASRPPQTPPDAKHQARISQAASARPESPKTPKTAALNRISILSFSSDSTKLGEIPERKWRSVMRYSETDHHEYEYNVRPTFPLRPYTVEVRERRFFGLFSRRREA